MATEPMKVLDRLATLLDQGGTECAVAIRNAAPSLIQLARAAIAAVDYEILDEGKILARFAEQRAAIKALGEVRL